MDDHTHGRNSVMGKSDKLKLRPSEYFMRQCVISCDSDERALKHVVDELNGENIVWNTDYPHPDAIEPARALPDFDAQAISSEAKRKILWDNAVKLFGPRLLS
jgi:predicted TIM-barrel fold metal-dependent hydrolase